MIKFKQLAAAAALALAGLHTQAAPVAVDVSGAASRGLLGDAGNTVWLVNVGANAVLNSLNWQVLLEAFTPSLLSEMQVSFGSSSGLDQVTLTPGMADALSGTGQYAGSVDLSGYGLSVGADGLLRLEFSEAFVDAQAGGLDGVWTSGQLTFDVGSGNLPEPAGLALALTSLAALATARRRMRGG
ncbi:PEP-CTERM sorting domain-containing protein [Roseateles sp. BYS87W]|uniref:PEP-CTERM sorting domain-containing protein n=1 Tax=Pelomonas baiyunensis TaxID=3299026 RepID=A0ABW7H4B6_9BURK